jgi:hypothetical protein
MKLKMTRMSMRDPVGDQLKGLLTERKRQLSEPERDSPEDRVSSSTNENEIEKNLESGNIITID